MVRNGCGQFGYILKMNRWNKLLFCKLDFWVGMGKNGSSLLVYDTLKSTVS